MWIILKKRLNYAIEKTDAKCYKNTINIKFFYGRIKYSWPSHKEIVVYSTIWTRPLLLQSQRAQILLLLQALQDPPISMNKYWVHSFLFSFLFSWFCVLILGSILIYVYITHYIMLIYSYNKLEKLQVCLNTYIYIALETCSSHTTIELHINITKMKSSRILNKNNHILSREIVPPSQVLTGYYP